MDPLSITCSAVTLIEATATVASSLYKVVRALRTADARVTALGDELRNFSGFLDAIDNALLGCRPTANPIDPSLPGGRLTDPTLLEDNLWQQSEQVLMDCKMTLHELEALFHRIKDEGAAGGGIISSSGSGRRKFGWRARTRTAINLNVHGPALDSFRDKIQKSNEALQTILHTITLSVMLRNSTSQQVISVELRNLKASIENVSRNASQQWMSANGYFRGRSGGRQLGDHSAARIARHLTSLAEAAQNFHSTASSAATVRSNYSGSNIVQGMGSWEAYPEAAAYGSATAMSLMGDGLSPFRRERVERFVGQQRKQLYQHKSLNDIAETKPCHDNQDDGSISVDKGAHLQARDEDNGYDGDNTRKNAKKTDEDAKYNEEYDDNENSDEEDEEDDDIDCKREVLDVLEELARDQIEQDHLDQAVEMLNKALKQEDLNPSLADRRRLRILLVLCHMMQHDWPQAEPLILELAAASSGANEQQLGRRRARRLSLEEQRDLIIVSNLLHALALAHLSIVDFDGALAHCRQALLMKKKLLKHRGGRKTSRGANGENNKSDDNDHADRTRDYNTTLGLLATIYEMTGDYIRAEVFRRQACRSQDDFVYHHSASEVEYLSGHFALLGMVLGSGRFTSGANSNVQELDASPSSPLPDDDTESRGSAEVTESTEGVNSSDGSDSNDEDTFDDGADSQQCAVSLHASESIYGLLQRKGSDGSGIAPLLRAQRDQWQRYERDTSKVVIIDSDSDSDRSSRNPPDSAICLDGDDDDSDRGKHKRSDSARLKRHLTKFFGRTNKLNTTSTATVTDTTQKDNSEASTSPSHHLSDKLQWLTTRPGTLFRKPRTLLRKRVRWPFDDVDDAQSIHSECSEDLHDRIFPSLWLQRQMTSREYSEYSEYPNSCTEEGFSNSTTYDHSPHPWSPSLLDDRQELPEDNFVYEIATQHGHLQQEKEEEGAIYGEEADDEAEDETQNEIREGGGIERPEYPAAEGWTAHPIERPGNPVPWLPRRIMEFGRDDGIPAKSRQSKSAHTHRSMTVPLWGTILRIRQAVLAHGEGPTSGKTRTTAAVSMGLGAAILPDTVSGYDPEIEGRANLKAELLPELRTCAEIATGLPTEPQNGTMTLRRTFSWAAGDEDKFTRS